MDDQEFSVESLRITPEQAERCGGNIAKAKGGTKRRTVDDPLIGCPMSWLQLVFPLVADAKGQIVVAIYLWRRRIVCRTDTFDLPNGELKSLGISHKVKGRTLKLLTDAGVIRVTRGSAKSSPTVTILIEKPGEQHGHRRP